MNMHMQAEKAEQRLAFAQAFAAGFERTPQGLWCEHDGRDRDGAAGKVTMTVFPDRCGGYAARRHALAHCASCV